MGVCKNHWVMCILEMSHIRHTCMFRMIKRQRLIGVMTTFVDFVKCQQREKAHPQKWNYVEEQGIQNGMVHKTISREHLKVFSFQIHHGNRVCSNFEIMWLFLWIRVDCPHLCPLSLSLYCIFFFPARTFPIHQKNRQTHVLHFRT